MKSVAIMVAVVLTGLAVGCGDDGSTTEPEPTRTEAVDLRLELTDFLPHIGQYSELRIVSQDDVLRMLVVLDPIDATEVKLRLSKGLPAGRHRVDLFADVNNNRQYDSVPYDHSWRVEIPETGILLLSHDTPFTDLREPVLSRPGDRFSLNLSGFGGQIGRLLELRLREAATGRTVAAYRRALIPDSVYQIVVEGMIEEDREYLVDFWVDRNFNFDYDAPPSDFAWRLAGTGGAAGLIVDFVFDSSFTDIGL